MFDPCATVRGSRVFELVGAIASVGLRSDHVCLSFVAGSARDNGMSFVARVQCIVATTRFISLQRSSGNPDVYSSAPDITITLLFPVVGSI